MGRGRLSARMAERKKRMDLSASANRAGAHERTGENIFKKNDAAAKTRVAAGRARIAAGAGERLAVHFARGHESRLRAPPCQRPFATFHRPARPIDRDERGRKMAART